MVAGAQRAELRPAALSGALADLGRVGAFQPPAFFRAAQVRLGGIAMLQRPARAFAADPLQLGLAQPQGALLAHAAGAVLVQGVASSSSTISAASYSIWEASRRTPQLIS